MIYTAQQGNNVETLDDIFLMYQLYGKGIADITAGNLRFWHRSKIPCWLWCSDIDSIKNSLDLVADYATLPYRDNFFDAVVFDPPYGNASTSPRRDPISKSYGLESCTNGYRVSPYPAGLREAYRIVKPKGYIIVKCQDGVNGGKQHWIHIDVYETARNIGLKAEDLFVVVQKGKPMMRHKYQVHARKNHSYFWVFKK